MKVRRVGGDQNHAVFRDASQNPRQSPVDTNMKTHGETLKKKPNVLLGEYKSKGENELPPRSSPALDPANGSVGWMRDEA